jgi:hypothetical protein
MMKYQMIVFMQLFESEVLFQKSVKENTCVKKLFHVLSLWLLERCYQRLLWQSTQYLGDYV